MKKHGKVFMAVFKLSHLKFAIVILFILSVLTFNFAGKEAVASMFLSTRNRKLPVYCVENNSKEIAITFDAGWGSDKTEKLLTILKENNIVATFFLVGMWVDSNEDLTKKICDRGMEIGTHSNTHADFVKLSESQMNQELSSSINKIEKITKQKVKLFRAPYGSYNNKVITSAENLGLQTIQWNVDSLDWKGIGSNKIISNVITKVIPGSIILCHNNAEHTAEALPTIIKSLKARGYKFVKVSELLLSGNFTIDHTGKQIAC